MVKEHYISLHANNITAAAVYKWCVDNLKEHQWIFESKDAVMGAPVLIKGNKPTYMHPRQRVERAHGGIIFFHDIDALAFELTFKIKHDKK